MGREKYPINYNVKKLFGYPTLSILIYVLSIKLSIDSEAMKFATNTLILLGFLFAILYIERKEINRIIKQ